MALVFGTNCGFCAAAPVDDPNGTYTQLVDERASATLDTSPATAIKVTEIGWWQNTDDTNLDYDVGIYTDDGNDEPETRIGLGNSTTSVGIAWQVVTGLNIEISSSTAYWIAFALENSSYPNIYTDLEELSDSAQLRTTETLPEDWGSDRKEGGEAYAIYAVWEAAAAGNTMTVNVDDAHKTVSAITVNVDDAWKSCSAALVNKDDAWKTIF